MTKMIDIQNLPGLRISGDFHGPDYQAFLLRPMGEKTCRFGADISRAFPDLISDASSVPDELRGSVMLLGNFDGFHRGHQQLLAEAKKHADRAGRPIGVMSVEPHPRQLFAPQSPAFRLSTPTIKAELLSGHGVDFLYSPRFDHRFAAQEPEQFVDDILVDGFNVGHLVVGAGFRFGRQRRGDVKMLRDMGERRGFGVSTVDDVRWNDASCSSTGVRNLLRAGEIEAANAMLGYEWSVELRRITPKAGDWTNVEWPDGVLLPGCGEYEVALKGLDGGELRSARISIRPHGQVRLLDASRRISDTAPLRVIFRRLIDRIEKGDPKAS